LGERREEGSDPSLKEQGPRQAAQPERQTRKGKGGQCRSMHSKTKQRIKPPPSSRMGGQISRDHEKRKSIPKSGILKRKSGPREWDEVQQLGWDGPGQKKTNGGKKKTQKITGRGDKWGENMAADRGRWEKTHDE